MNAEVTASLEAIRAACSQPSEIAIEGVPHVVMPQGFKLESLEALLPAPRRIKGLVRAHDLSGLIAYVEKFKDTDTAIYCGPVDAALIDARLDDHTPGKPSHVTHRCQFGCPVTPEWKTWTVSDKVVFDQVAFGEFIENNMRDIIKPDASDLLTATRNFSESRTADFKSSVKPINGMVQFHFTEDDGKKAGDIKFPDAIEIGVQVFEGLKVRYPIAAKLRYRIKDQKLTLWYELDRPDLTKRQAYNDLIDEVEKATGIQVFRAL
jgi:uncharacterized protein YfdQ (DUF2303 family)